MTLSILLASSDPVGAEFYTRGSLSATSTASATAAASYATSGSLSATAIIVVYANFSTAGSLSGAPISSHVTIIGESFTVTQTFNDGAIDTTPEPTNPPLDFDNYPADFVHHARSTYRYFVFDILTDKMLAEVEMTDVTYGHKLCAVGDFSGTISDISAQPDIDMYWSTMPMKTALYILRDEVAVWGGVIWNRQYDTATKQLKISAGTWESYLFRRYIWHTFRTDIDMDKYDVVRKMLTRMRRDFIDTYDPDYDYVTPLPEAAKVDTFVTNWQVHGQTSEVITFIREELKSFGEALTQFADNINGFEWNFIYSYNVNKNRFRRRVKFRSTPPILYPQGATPPPDTEEFKPGIDTYLFEYPGNIVTLNLDEDADNACTRQFVVGGVPAGLGGGGYGVVPIGSWNNNDAIAQGFPLVENVESSKHNTVTRQKRLHRLASIYGRQSAPPIRTWSVAVNGSSDPIIGTYQVGDWCRLIINDPFVQQSLEAAGIDVSRGVVKRIIGMSVKVPDGSQYPEIVTLELEDDVVVGYLEDQELAVPHPSDNYQSG